MKLRWYQEEAVQSLFNYFADPVRAHTTKPSNPLICLPTGTGKSLVIAEFIKRAMMQHPETRVIMSTHVKTLIAQNAVKMRDAWPLAPLGIYSAGLKSKDTIQPIIFGGVQSMVKKYPLFGKRHLLIVDEAHLIGTNADTSYLRFIKELTEGGEGATKDSNNYNPYLKVVGLTATRYRLGLGCLTNGDIFTDVAYDLCTIEGFNRLIAEGHLCPLVPKATRTVLDTTNVGLSKGEFDQNKLQDAVDKQEVTYSALQEVMECGHDRQSWLIFASGVEHANHICDMLNTVFGIPTVLVHSSTKDFPRTDEENDKAYAQWQSGEARAIVNMNSLTTGVDHPPCDLIVMLRPTMSTGLWVQMLGRGTRPYDGKANCLVLDFAGNTARLGPINDPVIPKLKGQGPPGDAPVKICKHCNMYNHTSAKVCFFCGEEFPKQEKLDRQASELELIRSTLPQFENFKVSRVVMVPHVSKASGRNSIKVAYFCGLRTFYEYISVESKINFFRHKSREWFRQRYHYNNVNLTWEDDVPLTDAEVIQLSANGELRFPTFINVWVNKQTPEIMKYVFT
jgi:DNA repair protein RadD